MIICILPGGDCSETSFIGKVFWTQVHFCLLFTQKLIVLLPIFLLSTYQSLFRRHSNNDNYEKWVSMKHVKEGASVFVSTRAPDANTYRCRLRAKTCSLTLLSTMLCIFRLQEEAGKYLNSTDNIIMISAKQVQLFSLTPHKYARIFYLLWIYNL